jgi:osmoprotectant transport system ATP-binding protein
MISLQNLTKLYGTTIAVKNFSLEIGSGEVCILIGPSGCGKTTLLKMINRLVEPTSGRILFDNRDISRIKPENLRRSIGYSIQNVGLFPHMTVAENVAVVPDLLSWKKARKEARITELLELVGLSPAIYRSKYPRELSGGEAQRIGVARALAADPPLLLMDEPFGAVDPLTREKLQGQFERIQRELKKTVILVTHDLDEAIRLSDRIAVMKSGQLMQYDTPENILSKPANQFVHDFVGVDRALKKLSRLSVSSFIKSAPFITLNTPVNEAISAIDNLVSIWVLDENGKLLGWANRNRLGDSTSIRNATVLPDMDEISIPEDATLRQALSIMLGQGIRSIPVVDRDKKFLGEISLRDIETATADKEENRVYRKD